VLTEEEAVFAFAQAWNRLEPDDFLSLLASDARYASQWVFEELKGSCVIADYLRRKMWTIRTKSVNDPDVCVRVEVGHTLRDISEIRFSPSSSEAVKIARTADRACGRGRPCAIVRQGNESATVIFKVADGKIARYDTCVAELYGYVGTGVYPI
jgi:hypothetical protein